MTTPNCRCDKTDIERIAEEAMARASRVWDARAALEAMRIDPKALVEMLNRATGAQLDEIARDLGMGERGDGFGEIWESDMCLRDSIRAKLELDAHSHPSASPRSSERI